MVGRTAESCYTGREVLREILLNENHKASPVTRRHHAERESCTLESSHKSHVLFLMM